MSSDNEDCPHCIDRRTFLKQGTAAGSAVVVCSILGGGFFLGCGNAPDPSVTGTPAGTANPISNNSSNIYTLSFSEYSALQNVGGSVHVSIAATSGKKDLFVTRVSSESVIAVSTVCTHQGCTLDAYDAGSQQYSCPCHGSVFSSNGSVVSGPANQSLQNYNGTITSSGVQLTLT